jgi:hypothetical protein
MSRIAYKGHIYLDGRRVHWIAGTPQMQRIHDALRQNFPKFADIIIDVIARANRNEPTGPETLLGIHPS